MRMKRFLVLLLLLLGAYAGQSQKRISLLTCGTGHELYSLFGHAAIRITDPAVGTDEVYNYGTFNGFEENFEIKYLRGKLLYYLAKETFPDFLQTYVAEGRSVQEQVLRLDATAAQKVYEALETNLLPQNAAYKYDFLYDNCATRIRDIVPAALGSSYQVGGADSIPYRTFRNSIDDYLAPRPWQKFGIDLLLGRPVDQQVSPITMQYLPDYLRSGMAHSRYAGQPVASAPEIILPKTVREKHPPDWPLDLFLVLLGVNVILWTANVSGAAEVMSRSVILITGMLGCLVVFMWAGTDHQACSDNWNFLWMLPTGIVGAFLRGSLFRKYALLAAIGLVAALVVHWTGIQQLPFKTGWPLAVVLAINYGMIYRRSLA
ncbi:MAG: DUF4105 domain-containing protein [Sphingobacteriales bacterium]|nr:MAG: DUF4105 domain-containing protein [Sphingobacteriales bacterium]